MIAALFTALAADLRLLPRAEKRGRHADAALSAAVAEFARLVLEHANLSTPVNWGARLADLRRAAAGIEEVLSGAGSGASLLRKWRVRRLRAAGWNAVCADLALEITAAARRAQGDPLSPREHAREIAKRARRYRRLESMYRATRPERGIELGKLSVKE